MIMKNKQIKTLAGLALIALFAACSSSTTDSNKSAGANTADTSKTVKAAPAHKQMYTCEMDTDVHSDKPGKCPKCGMDLVKDNR